MSAPHRLVLAALSLLALVMLAGCPPKEEKDEGSGLGKGPDKKEEARTEYRYPLPADARSLDPAQLTDTVSDAVCRRIYNTLVRFNTEGAVENDLCDSHEISPDGLVYTFHLHPGVRFHDGTPLTAKDVVYSYKRVLAKDTNSPRAMLLYYVTGAKAFHDGAAVEPAIKAVDDVTIEIKLDKPYAPFIYVLCNTPFAVLPQAAVEAAGPSFGDKPVGSGPFVFDEWQRDSQIKLHANEEYFRGAPAIKSLTFRILKDENTRFQEFKTGGLEHCDIPPSQAKSVLEDPKLKDLVIGRAAMDMYAYGFNCEQPPFKDNANLRLAFNHAVDKDNIVRNIWAGLVTEQKTYVPEGMPYFWTDAPGYPYDPDKAKELLESAGYPEGKGLPELVLNVDLQATNKLVAQAVQEDLRKVGVNVRIETVDWDSFLTKVYAGEALFFQNTWLTDYPDPDNWLYQLLCSENFGDGGNITRWRNTEFDTLVKQAQVEIDQGARDDLYKHAEGIAYEEAPWLLLFWKNSSTLVQPYVQGFTPWRLDRTPQLANVPLEKVTLE
jgi:oligopeptide transport system substrate-binding protein